MRNSVLFLFMLFCNHSFAQLSVGHEPYTKKTGLDSITMSRFKATTTLFILPDKIPETTYDSILKAFWTITPYHLIKHSRFHIEDIDSNKHSFAYISTTVKTIDKPKSIHVFIFSNLDLFMVNPFHKKEDWLSHKVPIASVGLYPKNTSLRPIADLRKKEMLLNRFIYEENPFFDFNPGFFKNYIQQINTHLKQQLPFYLYETETSSELKNLSNAILYIPEYLGLKFNGFRETNSAAPSIFINNLFESYEYRYSIVSRDNLSRLIMDQQPIYYARFTRINTQRFLQIVNAHTGNIVYRTYISGSSYHLKQRQITQLSEAIKKAVSKL